MPAPKASTKPVFQKLGLESVASCAVDDDWSALKLMFPKAQRR